MVGERLHAEVPPHRRGDLVHEQLDGGVSCVDGRAVVIGPQGDAGVGCCDIGGGGAQRLDGGGHVAGVEGSGDLQRNDAGAGDGRLRECGERGEGPGSDDLTSAVVVRGRQVELRQTREHSVAVAADDGTVVVAFSAVVVSGVRSVISGES